MKLVMNDTEFYLLLMALINSQFSGRNAGDNLSSIRMSYFEQNLGRDNYNATTSFSSGIKQINWSQLS